MSYEKLIEEYSHVKIIEDSSMPRSLSGLCKNNVIRINRNLKYYDKHCILAEEIGHFETTFGDITDQSLVRNRQLEAIARRWAYTKVVSLEKIIDCYLKGHTTLRDMCIHLEITPKFLKDSIDFYIAKFGSSQIYGQYTVEFEPLNVSKK